MLTEKGLFGLRGRANKFLSSKWVKSERGKDKKGLVKKDKVQM